MVGTKQKPIRCGQLHLYELSPRFWPGNRAVDIRTHFQPKSNKRRALSLRLSDIEIIQKLRGRHKVPLWKLWGYNLLLAG